MAYIYKIVNKTNNKVYIGKTNYVNPFKRFDEHIRDSKKERCKNRPLYRAFSKYGIHNFEFIILEETDDEDNREKYYISLYNSFGKNGYNATLGGDGRPYINLDEDEVIKYHIYNAKYQILKTKNHFRVDAKTIKEILLKHNIDWLNKNQSIKKSHYDKNGDVYQVDINTNKIINKFNSWTNANEVFGKDKYNGNIKDACNGRRKSHLAYGYRWFYSTDSDDFIQSA